MKPRVELVYDLDCPNVTETRAALVRAFAQAGLTPSWIEWDRNSPETPDRVRRYGSPTILVDGEDIVGLETGGGDCCRLYRDSNGGFQGVPSVNDIAKALSEGSAPSKTHPRFHWRRVLTVLPGIGASVLPVGICPACWPAYAGVLSSLGLGFLVESSYLLPLITVFLGVALIALTYRAKSRRGYGPLLLGVVGAVMILVGKFALSSDSFLYLGLAVLVAASVWNAWPKNKNVQGSCPACAHQVREVERSSAEHGG